MMEGPGADSEEKRVLASDLDTVMVDSLKALDLIRPIREADISGLTGCLFRQAVGCKRGSLWPPLCWNGQRRFVSYEPPPWVWAGRRHWWPFRAGGPAPF